MLKICPKCGKPTCNLIYKVRDNSGKEKQLVGKECTFCGNIYYTETIVEQHLECFRQTGAFQKQIKSEPKRKIESEIEEKTGKVSIKKTEANTKQNVKKKTVIFSTFCPEHNIALRTPVMWKPGIPLFSCPQCEKYYISSDKYQYGSVVEKFRERPVINVELIITNGREPVWEGKNSSKEQTDEKSEDAHKEEFEERESSAFSEMNEYDNNVLVTDEKSGDQQNDQRVNDASETKKDIRMQGVSQHQSMRDDTETGSKTYTDDFGVEFDFSELENILILKLSSHSFFIERNICF